MLRLCLSAYVASVAALTTPPPSLSRRQVIGSTSAAAALAATGPPSLVRAADYKLQPGAKLITGENFPTASFGLQVYDDTTAEQLTLIALELGYRNFFASVLARNQKGFARAIKKSGVPRDELFICGSVLSNQAQGFDAAYKLSARGCKENLEAFAVGGIDYVDMIMLDYPGTDDASIKGQWKALEEMHAAGTAKTLAVSNFSPKQLDVVASVATSKATMPTVNQLPYGVGFAGYYNGKAAEIVAENRKRGVVVQAWSPLRKALKGRARDACAEIGQKYGKSAAQVGLKWIAQANGGATYTTQTKSKEHFKEDLEIFDFTLTAEEIATLSAI